jgi:glutamate synthase (NADPH/NADH) small chain
MIYRVSSAHEEAGERLYSVSTKEFLKDSSGNLTALRLVETQVIDGRFQEITGSDKIIPADLVFLALGFSGPEKSDLLNQLEVKVDERGNIERDHNYATQADGVFVCGDAGRGQSLIVWAIAEGRSAAAAVDRYLTGNTQLPFPIEPTARPMMV